MIRSLRKKFVLAAVSAVFLVLFVLLGTINVIAWHRLVAEADDTLRILSENSGTFPRQMFFAQEDLPEDGEQPPELPPDLPEPTDGPRGGGRRGGTGGFGILNGEGGRGGFGELAYQSRYFIARFDGAGDCVRLDLDNVAAITEDGARTLARSVYDGGREKGFAEGYRYARSLSDGETMLLFLNCQRELATFRGSLYASVGISLLGLLALFLLLLPLSGRVVRPIAESHEKQKRFITDAGHELKTPITIIRADADVLESELDDGENEWIADIRRQTQRLAELTADLVYLSRMEEENAALQISEFSLSELTEETAQSFQALALSGGKSFEAAVAPGLRMTGDRKAIGKLLSVLLENAMKYSKEGGAVSLTLERAGKNARLTVKNSASPMEKGNADRLFERFARGDSSRSTESGGFGLGLAIAKAVTEAHRGRIHAVSEDGASLTVTAELPVSDRA